jgi:PhnB protein
VLIGLTDVERARNVFGSLAEGGRVTMPFEKTFWSPEFGVLVDRFGVTWEVNAQDA